MALSITRLRSPAWTMAVWPSFTLAAKSDAPEFKNQLDRTTEG